MRLDIEKSFKELAPSYVVGTSVAQVVVAFTIRDKWDLLPVILLLALTLIHAYSVAKCQDEIANMREEQEEA